MSKEEIALAYSIVIVIMLISYSIVIHFKNKKISKLRIQIDELDKIYYDEIQALEKLLPEELKIKLKEIDEEEEHRYKKEDVEDIKNTEK